MAIPRGFKRGSGGFLQPTGSVPSGASSGPGRFALADRGHKRLGMQKVLASFGKAQKVHEGVMAKIATAETAAVERITKAYNESKKNDPKDELGRTVPSPVTSHLGKQLINLMGMASQRGAQTATPGAAGVKPEQIAEGQEFGFGGRMFPDEAPRLPLQDTGGVTSLMGPEGQQGPQVGELVEVASPQGGTVQVTIIEPPDENGMVKVRLQDGSEAAIPMKELAQINLEDQLPGEPGPDPGGQRLRFQQHERQRATLKDLLSGL